jgi:Family of unknown function (DUF6272)
MIIHPFAQKEINDLVNTGEPYSDMILVYGNIEQNLVSPSLKTMDAKIRTLNYSKAFASKAKTLCVEIVQNIFKHQNAAATLKPFISVGFIQEGLQFVCGNSVDEKSAEFLVKKLEEYNLMTKDQLKGLYIQALTQNQLTVQGNAGLGLLTICSKSSGKAIYQLNKYSDSEYYFCLKVDLAL